MSPRALFLTLLLATAASSYACQEPSQEQARYANYESDVDAIAKKYRAQLVSPLCQGDVEGFKACGLLFYSFRDRATTWARYNCQNVTADECLDAYAKLFTRELSNRYDRAVFDEVMSRCSSDSRCNGRGNWALMELFWLESHNEHVWHAEREELAARSRQDRADQATLAARERQAEAMAAALKEMQRTQAAQQPVKIDVTVR